VVERLGFLDDAVAAIKYHHERWDGTGYPERLRGESIPLEARIIQVAEAYDSMVTNPTYRPTRTEQEALDELHRLAGKQFCPRCVGAFERALVGTAVRTAVAEPATSA
jgi:HD-GYP domain-containing protein (c-di-GMP phosphodiesterase class II)